MLRIHSLRLLAGRFVPGSFVPGRRCGGGPGSGGQVLPAADAHREIPVHPAPGAPSGASGARGSWIGTADQCLPCTAEDEEFIAVRDGEPGALTETGAE